MSRFPALRLTALTVLAVASSIGDAQGIELTSDGTACDPIVDLGAGPVEIACEGSKDFPVTGGGEEPKRFQITVDHPSAPGKSCFDVDVRTVCLGDTTAIQAKTRADDKAVQDCNNKKPVDGVNFKCAQPCTPNQPTGECRANEDGTVAFDPAGTGSVPDKKNKKKCIVNCNIKASATASATFSVACKRPPPPASGNDGNDATDSELQALADFLLE